MSGLIPLASPAPRVAMLERLAPVRTLFEQPLVRRLAPALATLAAVLIAGVAWLSLREAPQRALFDTLAETDKAAVAEALDTAGLAYTLDGASGALSVAENDYHRARMLLAAQGLPKGPASGTSLLADLPMGASRAREGEALRQAQEADLARTVEAIDGVTAARVHLATPDPSPFLGRDRRVSASVVVTLANGRALSEGQVRAIGQLVASSVPELDPSAVAVIDQAGRLVSKRGGASDAMLDLQEEMEQRARTSLATLLTPLVGPDGYVAEVTAELEPAESQSTRETYPKDDRALRREEGNRATSPGSTPAAGIPGALSNLPPAPTVVSATPPAAQPGAPGTPPMSSEENYARTFDNGREISVTHQPSGRLRRLSVAIALKQGDKPRSAAELLAIEGLVKGAIGFDAARGDVVTVAARPFVAPSVETHPIYAQPWAQSAARQGGAALVALIVFFVLMRTLRKHLKAREAQAAERAALEQQLLDAPLPTADITLDMIAAAPSYEARAQLVKAFVKQDPAKAALVVRQMLGKQA